MAALVAPAALYVALDCDAVRFCCGQRAAACTAPRPLTTQSAVSPRDPIQPNFTPSSAPCYSETASEPAKRGLAVQAAQSGGGVCGSSGLLPTPLTLARRFAAGT